jgi:polyphosphate kinase 2 (PPK2 family)
VNAPEDVITKLEQMKKPEKIESILENIKNFQSNISNKDIVYKKYISLISASS